MAAGVALGAVGVEASVLADAAAGAVSAAIAVAAAADAALVVAEAGSVRAAAAEAGGGTETSAGESHSTIFDQRRCVLYLSKHSGLPLLAPAV